MNDPIRPVRSESSLSAWMKLGSLATHWVHSKDSDQTGWIWVFAGCTVILLVLPWGGSDLFLMKYRKNPKNSDNRKICGNHPKILKRWLYHSVMCPKDADGMANSVDPDQSNLIWIYTVCPGLSVQELRSITALFSMQKGIWSGSTLFAISSASFGCFTLRNCHLVKLLGWLQ